MLTNIIIVLCGLAFGAGCLGVGYLLGKKKKMTALVQAEIERIRAQANSILAAAKTTAKETVNKL